MEKMITVVLVGAGNRANVYASVSKLLAHDSCQSAAAGFGDIGYAQLRSICLVAGTQSGDDWDIALKTAYDQICFAGYEVDSVYHIVII